ncbi:MAG: hypothetical protein IRY92_13150, partial [Dactylosporangium sp.]|nr:hypothetical protein [Dactylosporangium sp.]
LGSFEGWSYVIGGILECAGIPGFLDNIMEFYEAADTEGAMWRHFVAEWWDKYGDRPVSAGDLFEIAQRIDGFDLGRGTTERAQKTAFGMRLARQRDRVFEHHRIEAAGTRQRAQLWRLVRADVNLVNLSEPFYTMPRAREATAAAIKMNLTEYEKVHQGSLGSPASREAAAAADDDDAEYF